MKYLGPNNRLPELVPERLREARLVRGYTTGDLADALGVSRQVISKYELGQAKPGGAVLGKMVEELGLPLAYFCSPVPNRSTVGTTYFRSLKSATRRSREMLTVRAHWMEDIVSYCAQFVDFPQVNLPDCSDFIYEGPLEGDTLEEASVFVRRQWGLGLGPIGNVTLLLEKQGVFLTRIGFDNLKTDAFSQWREARPFVFLGSDKESAVRSRFDAAHELGHLLLHVGLDGEQLADTQTLFRVEKEANRFAGAFLLPADTFRREVISTSLDHFIALKKRWRVSISAMIYRCEDLGILSENQVLYLRKQLSRLRMRTREPLDDVLEVEKPSLLRQAISMLIENGVQSPGDILDALNLPPHEVEELCCLDRGTLAFEGKLLPLRLKV